ncbi:hypothetical protein [Streptomyces sp. sk2.1]|uniref:hypothetical protein n=1 Tax=Streptomyces sp. sk2.1 TaxID=2478959 RepID=UPI0011E66F1D|nr:hypothetical protein [Streptomyces sp. sk2.1]TXS72131.1 hypothetical protein EAO76_19270 [Streptomyces sp. sk2.1]
MSSNDQQYPYGQDPGHGYGPGAGQPHSGQPYDTSGHGTPGHDDRSYGAHQSYGEQQSYGGQQSYGEQQSYGGGQQSYGEQQSYGGGQYGAPSHGGQDPYGARTPYDPNQAPQAQYDPDQVPREPQGEHGSAWPTGYGQEPAGAQGPQDPGVAQTWEGQTWDTQYQPTVHRAQPTQPAQPVQPEQPVPAAAGTTAYLPPQGASGAYPLPPEVPAAPAASPAGEAGASAVVPSEALLDADGYGAPTTLGNSRVTDAQRARAEGRSPIIAPGMQPAAITAGLGLLLALGAAIGQYALVVPLVLLQAVTAAGWFRLNGMWPARQGIMLAFAGGLVADVALLAAGRENGPAAILGTLGIWVLLTVVLQLRSRASADDRMHGLMATVASAALSVLAAGHLAAVPDAVTAGAIAVAAAVVVRALPLPGPASVVVALLVAAGAGAVAGTFTDLGAKGALLGLAAGGCALIGLRVASYDYPSRFVHMTAGVALPLTAAAPAVHLLGRVLP